MRIVNAKAWIKIREAKTWANLLYENIEKIQHNCKCHVNELRHRSQTRYKNIKNSIK